MISVLVPLLLLMAGPFWEAQAPKEWTDAQLEGLLADSPWAQVMAGPGQSALAVNARLALASPIEQAEKEQARRAALRSKPGAKKEASDEEDPGAREYRLWLEDNRATQIILAIRMTSNEGLLDEKEVRRMEDESVMRVGKKKIKMTGHFPPSAGDPFLRMAFPREVQLSDKSVIFDVYLPGVSAPFRSAEFKLKDMVVGGKLEL
ncbi:MAG TPA: hypothetical protein VGN17_31465 [Bryobacteraceae bacterium]|jgi:hypothetical protein